MMEKNEKLGQLISGLEYDVPLDRFTTIGLGGNARYFFQAKSVDELVNAVIAARTLAIKYVVLGYGSNVLFSDSGFDGLVVVNRASQVRIESSTGRVIADSGASLSKMIMEAGSQLLSGLEPLYGIPGTVGGAICVNAGAHGVSIASYLKSATILISSEKIISVVPEWFKFEYRKSKIKYVKEDFPPVILSAIFQFHQKKKEDIVSDIAKFKQFREEHQPIGEKTTGSVFRNPGGSDNLKDDKEKSAGYLLDTAGAKKIKQGNVRVSKKHANWIINNGHSTSQDARLLIEQMRRAVDDKYSLELEEEIEYLGNWNDS